MNILKGFGRTKESRNVMFFLHSTRPGSAIERFSNFGKPFNPMALAYFPWYVFIPNLLLLKQRTEPAKLIVCIKRVRFVDDNRFEGVSRVNIIVVAGLYFSYVNFFLASVLFTFCIF